MGGRLGASKSEIFNKIDFRPHLRFVFRVSDKKINVSYVWTICLILGVIEKYL